jgi:CHAT domain-containing protein
VSRMLCEERFQVSLHVTIGATKLRVSQDLKGVDWAHFSCHADKDTQSLLLATPHVSTIGADKWALMKSLSMKDVETEVEMGVGSTAVLSACDTGLGEIKPEGVMGLARGFLSAGASATVVSLWSVDDGSTALLMEHMYTEMAQEGQALGLKWKEAGSEKPCTGTEIKNDLLAAVLQKQVEFKNEEWQNFQVGDLCSNSYIKAGDRYFKPADAQCKTVAQALRASMLRLARCRAADGQAEAWKRPYYWAGFVVVGATTRLRLPSTQAAS